MAAQTNDLKPAQAGAVAGSAKDKLSSYTVRAIRGDDGSEFLGLILSKWLRSLRFGNDYFRLIDSASYYKTYDIYIRSILQRPHVVIRLAVLSDDHDVVLGFSVIEDATVLHYIHIHKDQRGLGIAKHLLPRDLKTITHVTKDQLKCWPKGVAFNPFYPEPKGCLEPQC